MLSLNDIQGRAYIKFDTKDQLWSGKDLMIVKPTQSKVRSVRYGHKVLAISGTCYYSLKHVNGESKMYHYSEIDELKHLTQTTLTNSNWYDTVHVMD
jgi:hypothetical protein